MWSVLGRGPSLASLALSAMCVWNLAATVPLDSTNSSCCGTKLVHRSMVYFIILGKDLLSQKRWIYVVICCDMLWYVVICCNMLWYDVICCDMLQYVMICSDMLWYVVICCDILWYVVICCDMLWYLVISCDIEWLCCVILASKTRISEKKGRGCGHFPSLALAGSWTSHPLPQQRFVAWEQLCGTGLENNFGEQEQLWGATLQGSFE